MGIKSLVLLLPDSAARGPGFKGHHEAGVYARNALVHHLLTAGSNPVFSLVFLNSL